MSQYRNENRQAGFVSSAEREEPAAIATTDSAISMGNESHERQNFAVTDGMRTIQDIAQFSAW